MELACKIQHSEELWDDKYVVQNSNTYIDKWLISLNIVSIIAKWNNAKFF